MRKALIAVCLLLAVSLGGAAAVHREVDRDRDQVVITEKVLYGNKAHTQGLHLRVRTHLNGHLHWDTAYVAGDQPRTSTQFRFTDGYEYPYNSHEPQGLILGGWDDIPSPDWDRAASVEELSGMDIAYWNLFQETPAGEEREKRVLWEDYYDYYPISPSVDLYHFFMDSGSYAGRRQDEFYEEKERVRAALREFLKIPVLPGEALDISVSKGPSGSITGWGSGTSSGDRYGFGTWNAVTEDALYFALDGASREGRLMDFSHVPGGYGIYRLPYEAGVDGWIGVEEENLSMVYPLEQSMEIIWFTVTPDDSRLLMMGVEDGICRLRVIRRSDMTTLQTLDLYRVTEDLRPWGESCHEGYVLLRTSQSLILLEEEGDGRYRTAIDIPVEDSDRILAGIQDTCWDGERLAVISEYESWEDGGPCAFTVGVFSADGELFGAKYTSSLDTGGYEYYDNDNCTLWGQEALEVFWQQ